MNKPLPTAAINIRKKSAMPDFGVVGEDLVRAGMMIQSEVNK
ncbi:MAG TPA: hypothetical protein VFC41_06315 [Anaerovoracaceae bacterium]|nr:hypothetical protein [Anaerovoracaceae bacterium]